MSHKRKGQLTTSGELAKHLRPFFRRAFWKKERKAVHEHVREEGMAIGTDRPNSVSVETLVAQVQSLSPALTEAEIWVPAVLTLNGTAIPMDVAMSILVDKLLAQGLFPDGFSQAVGGRLYRYRKE